jgi:hypothetical protein
MRPTWGSRIIHLAHTHTHTHCISAVSIRQHTTAYASIREHTPAYVSIRETCDSRIIHLDRGELSILHQRCGVMWVRLQRLYIRSCIPHRTSAPIYAPAYVRIRQDTSGYVRIRQHTGASVSGDAVRIRGGVFESTPIYARARLSAPMRP